MERMKMICVGIDISKGKTGYETMTSLNSIRPIEDSVVYDYMLKK
jgi:hypothetical protein